MTSSSSTEESKNSKKPVKNIEEGKQPWWILMILALVTLALAYAVATRGNTISISEVSHLLLIYICKLHWNRE